MRAVVDRERCQGHAQCLVTAPDVFDLDDDSRSVVLTDPVPPGSVAAAQEAADRCPEAAISLTPRSGPAQRSTGDH